MQLRAGSDILTISDPCATGEVLGPNFFSKFALPFINTILEELQEFYDAIIVHICGNLRSILPLVNQLKTTAISIDSATSIYELLKMQNGKVVIGNVSTHLLLNSNPNLIKRVSRACLKKGASALAPGCGVSPETPLSNLKAMAEAVREH